ncbi:hypothetical protein [Stutzerimonas tarimensis]|uniref:Uncharacterized protein n=1 Tax=Stutzerimonas tarimensis TaxID=1507735 RepID=A0ABV7T5D8_9GAMM
MVYIRWIGLIACSIAALAYLALGNFNLAGLMLALAAISLINIRRPRGDRRDLPQDKGKRDL